MRILVVGAGALGGLVGAKLIQGEQEVIFLEADPARVDRLNREGLCITEDGKKKPRISIRVVTGLEGMDSVDLVFVAVKSYQTEAAIRSVMPVIAESTRVLSMQNGIGNTEVMAKILGPDKILSGIIYHSIQHTGQNSLHFRPGILPIQIAPFQGKPTPEIQRIGEVFRKVGLNTDVVENIDHVIWHKLLHNAVVNPVSALTGLNCNQLLESPELQLLMRGLCQEIVAVMQARGIPLIDQEDPYRPVIDSQKALGPNYPSMWQDLSRGLRTEIDALNGAILEEAKRLGLSAPMNQVMVCLVHARERHQQET